MLQKLLICRFFFLSFGLFLIQSCLDFGEDFETREPTEEQVAACKDRAWIIPDSELKVQGIKWLGSGIDTAFWMAFTLEKEDRDTLFHSNGPSWEELQHENLIIHDGPEWWTPQGKMIRGGQVLLPNGGTVEIFWMEEASRIRVSLFYFET